MAAGRPPWTWWTAERRFAAVIDNRLGDIAGLAACDELTAATDAGVRALDSCPCPDQEAELLIEACLHAYSQVAQLMRDAVSASSENQDVAIQKVAQLHGEVLRDSARLTERIEEILGET